MNFSIRGRRAGPVRGFRRAVIHTIWVAASAMIASAAGAQVVPQGTIRAIAFEPGNPARVYAGGYGTVYRSDDAGGTWQASFEPMVVWSIVVPPDSGTVLAATQARGVLRSTDLGQTWTGTPGWTETIHGLAASADGTVVYAGSDTMLYRSSDSGVSWQTLTAFAAAGQTMGIVLNPQNPNVIYVAQQDRGIHSTVDGGVTWTLNTAGLDDLYLVDLDVDPVNSSMLYTTTLSGVFRSVDAGVTWLKVPFPGATYALAIDPTSSQRLLAATTVSGIHRSLDGGASWQAVNNGLGGVQTFFAVAFAPDASGRVYAGSQDNGLFLGADFGDRWWRAGDPEPQPGSEPPPSPPPTSTGTAPALSLEIVDLQNGENVHAGSTASFRIVLRNTGDAIAVGTSLHVSWVRKAFIIGTDTPMPKTLRPSAGSCSSSYDCDLGAIAPGATVTVSVAATTQSGWLGSYELRTSVKSMNANGASDSLIVRPYVTIFSSEGGGGAFGLIDLLALLTLGVSRYVRAGRAARAS